MLGLSTREGLGQAEDTHTGSLLHSVQNVLGWKEKVQQAAQGVSVVTSLDDLEELAEESWGSGLKGRVEHREKVLDRTLQTI